MADNTKIEWTAATANYVNGCSVVSPGCTNCYAMRLAGTRLRDVPSRAGLTQPSKAGPVWTGEVRRNEAVLKEVLGWKKPRRIFWNAHGDLFHPSVPDEWIDAAFAAMGLTPQHTHQVPTKPPERMREYMKRMDRAFQDWFLRCDPDGLHEMPHFAGAVAHPRGPRQWPLPNVWLGTSVEDQARADERIPHLLATPAAVRFISAEPLLGPVDLSAVPWDVAGHQMYGAVPDRSEHDDFRYWHHETQGIRWVIVGGESGPGARPMHPDWARSLRDQCAAAGIPFHFKQWGAWLPAGQVATQTGLWNPSCGSSLLTTKKNAGRLLDGQLHDGFPA